MVVVQFFPYDATYKIIDGKAHVYLYGRAVDDGRRIIVVDDSFEPYFYAVPKAGYDSEELKQKLLALKLQDGEDSAAITKVELIEKQLKGKPLMTLKITANLPKAVPRLREALKAWSMLDGLYEYDILFARRYLIDKGIIPMTLCEAEGELITIRSRVRVLKAASIRQFSQDTFKSPRVLAVDIETYMPPNMAIDTQKNPILMLALYGEDFKRVYSWKHFPNALPEVEFVPSELELIEKFKLAVEEYKPDILTGYYSDGFDMPYIKARADKYKLKLDIGPDYAEPKMRGRDDSEFHITGIAHIDVFKFIKRITRGALETEGYSLNAVASQLLGEKKQEVDLDALSTTWDYHPEKLAPFAAYNLHDAYLAYQLMLKMLPTLTELVKIVGLPPVEVSRMGFSQMVEWYLLRQAPGFNEIAPNKPSEMDISRRYAQSLEGGFVYEPKPGLYHDIVVFDYLSLYPTIISSHNIGPEVLRCACCREIAEKVPGEDAIWFCTKWKGFIPNLIEDIVSRRMRVKELMKEASGEDYVFLNARQGALKLMANSFYGYLGFSVARWYSFESASATTAYGRHYIHQVISKAQQKGFTVLYSDTDSVFLALEGRARAEAFAFVQEINEHLPGLMELEFEGFYPSGIFVSAKMGAYGAKKKYALLSENGALKIRGFETVRRNWAEIAKETQEKVLGIILKENDPKKAADYTKHVLRELREKKVPIQKVVIRMQLVKELLDYAAKGPHVAAAERMRQKGMSVSPGTIINYVVTNGDSVVRDRVRLPEEVAQGEYDAEYYISNQVIPAVERIFDVLGYSVEMLTQQHHQQTLASFFN